jgi:hypothetical protein
MWKYMVLTGEDAVAGASEREVWCSRALPCSDRYLVGT